MNSSINNSINYEIQGVFPALEKHFGFQGVFPISRRRGNPGFTITQLSLLSAIGRYYTVKSL